MFKNKFNSKYSDVLTIVLVVLIVIIFGIVGYFGYDIYNKSVKTEGANAAMAEFEQATKSVKKKKVTDTAEAEDEIEFDQDAAQQQLDAMQQNSAQQEQAESSAQSVPKVMYEGYEMLGKISIPKIKCEYPILAEVTKHSLEVAVAKLYGPEGLNQVGNTVIVGHNYRNGMFFSNNNKLAIGDTINITSATETVTYKIYNIYQTTPDDAEYMRRDTQGTREISLSTCNNDSSLRLIIWAREV